MDEVGIEDELVVVDLLVGDDEAEGLDEKFAVRAAVATSYTEVGSLALPVLAFARVVHKEVVQCLAAVAAGDDDGQP